MIVQLKHGGAKLSQCGVRIALQGCPIVLAVGAAQEIEIAPLVGLQDVVKEEPAVTARVVAGQALSIVKAAL